MHKNGDVITIDHIAMILPHVGNLVDIVLDGEEYVARIVGVNHEGAKLKIVSKDTRY